MLRLIPRKLLLQVGLTALCLPSLAMGQIFARAAFEEAAENTSCGLSACPPSVLTYGYYHENWRRWPEEPSTTTASDALSPFAKPDRRTPAIDLPEPRMEDSMAPRRRRASSGATESPQSRQTTPTPQARPLPPQEPDRQDGLPALPPSDADSPMPPPSLPSGQDSFFPQDDETETGALPEVFPDEPLEDSLPPLDLENGQPGNNFNEQPADDNPEDVFNLDDFGQVNPQRLQRYRMSSAGHMRRPGSTQPRPTRRVAGPRQAAVQLATYRSSSNGRRNPLRANAQPATYELQTGVVEPAAWTTEPIEPNTVEHTDAPLESAGPVDSPRHSSLRNNPLR